MSTWMTRDGRPIEVRPARGAFDDFAAVVGPKTPGTPGCWCMAYRDARKGLDDRIAHMKSECATEPGPGVLAYIEGVVAGWCSVAPRSSYRRLMNSRTIPNLQKLEIDERDPWAIVCFVVRAGYRKKGVARALLGGAIEHVRAHGGICWRWCCGNSRLVLMGISLLRMWRLSSSTGLIRLCGVAEGSAIPGR